MNAYTSNHYIEIVAEKRVQSASKGRNQWIFLQKFDGKRVVDFIEAAKVATRLAPSGTYQNGNWWDRELDHCRRTLGVIRIVEGIPPAAISATAEADDSVAERGARPVLPERPPTTQGGGVADSGLYLVTLTNEDPISANAHDARIAETCVAVNRDNCKFGKARSLRNRSKNYCKTFGARYANFLAIAAVSIQDLERAERLVAEQLRPYRICGPSGRITEWMKGIEPTQVVRIAMKTLEECEIRFTKLC
ncbi:GIY-YIG nuclease family protein [Thiohalocapsa marina]|uniref:GIY-YIG nuclease family protein n=1 Tax=Thiohalocapsa marina TaxID=424902 RepID=UPI0036D90D50